MITAAPPPLVVHADARISSYRIKSDGSFRGAVAAFGKPVVRHPPNRGCVASWPRLGLRIGFYNLGGADQCTWFHDAQLTRSGSRTANGLRIGDSAARALRLFPHATRHRDWFWLITRTSTLSAPAPALAARITRGRVSMLQVVYPRDGD